MPVSYCLCITTYVGQTDTGIGDAEATSMKCCSIESELLSMPP